MNNSGGEKHHADVSAKDDAIKGCVFEVDIFGELVHKRILHGQGPFWSILLGFRRGTIHTELPVKNQ